MKRGLITCFSSFLIAIIFSSNLIAQSTVTVGGKVTDATDNLGLPGVSIQEKGTSRGGITDFEGNYSLTVEEGATLVFSYIGYVPVEIEVGTQATINVALEVNPTELSEVLVIGYGQQEKGDVTGVVQAVNAKDFNKGAIVSPDQLITGKVAGVQITSNSGEPGGQTSIRIRGGTSINASNEPLYVIDGVPIDNSPHNPGGFSGGRNPLNFLNPSDIETFTVLKDASATAIYGSRGANGVIIITTKRGNAGSKTSVTYDGYVSVGQLSSSIDVLNAEQFRNVVTAKSPSRLSVLGDADTNWFDEILQTAVGQNHNLSITGGGENMGYRVSVGHMDQDGILKTSNTQRTSFSLNYNHSLLNDALTINTNLKTSLTKDRFAPNVVGSAYVFDPTQPVYDENSKWGGYFEYDNDLAPDNPVSTIDQTQDFGEAFRSIGNMEFSYKMPFLEGLSAKLNLGYDITNGERERFQPSTLRGQSSTNGELRREDYKRQNLLLDAYLNYKKNLENINSDFDVTVGYSYQDFVNEFPSFRAWDLDTDIFGLNSTSPATEFTASTSIQENRLISFFGRVNYSFMDRYLLTLTVRRDGSSRFGESDRWGIFPSAALAWRILDEPFAESLTKVFSNLKLRVGYGITGNQDIGNYRYLATYTQGDAMTSYQFGDQYVTTLRPNGYDAGLKWEETSSLNAGLDFGFFEGRLTGAIEYYQKNTKDLLFDVSVAAGANLTNIILTNIGEVQNNGVELSLDGVVIDKPNFDWNLAVNFSHNKNEIKALDQINDPNFEGYTTGGISGGVGNNIQILRVGEAVNAFYVYDHILDENGDPLVDGVDHNGDGTINLADMYQNINGDELVNDNDKRPYKSPAPDLLFGLTSSMYYKNFDFSFTMRGSLGNYAYNNVASNNGYYNRVITEIIPNNIHTSALQTGFTSPQYFSDYYVEDASFLRMDNITLGYTAKQLKNVQMRLYGTVQNLFVLTDYSGLDPETNNGIDNNLYPRSRTFILGVNISL
ncbi:MAG: SusC/RagA family TonB-linked outer membrane protein [Thalassobius sp.]|nr:SusC/RagA family TonB-linked outer membrane protein [Thalassovita sp.]